MLLSWGPVRCLRSPAATSRGGSVVVAERNGVRAEHGGGADPVDLDTAYRGETDRPQVRVGAAGCPSDLKGELITRLPTLRTVCEFIFNDDTAQL